MAELRPMREEDVPGAHDVTVAAFEDLDRRLREPPHPPADTAAAYVRLRRILATDPGGCWVAEDGAGLAGVALAHLRSMGDPGRSRTGSPRYGVSHVRPRPA